MSVGEKSASPAEEGAFPELHFGNLTVLTVNTGEPWRQNCYIVCDELSREALVVDPGGRAESIIGEVRKRDLRVAGVFLTHAHHDHVGAVAVVCRELGVPCSMNEGDARLLRQAPLYAFRFGGRQIETPAPVQNFQADQYALGAHRVVVHHAPGHTEGSVVLEFLGFAITGDTILKNRVGRTDLPGGDPVKLRKSVDSLLALLPSSTVLLSGHGSPWTVEEARTWWRTVADNPPALDAHEAIA